jgi:HAMP domain-containing protein
VDDAFEATRRLIDIEHAADDAERRITGLVLSKGDANGGVCILELARTIERATDRLARIGHLIHEHMMAELST